MLRLPLFDRRTGLRLLLTYTLSPTLRYFRLSFEAPAAPFLISLDAAFLAHIFTSHHVFAELPPPLTRVYAVTNITSREILSVSAPYLMFFMLPFRRVHTLMLLYQDTPPCCCLPRVFPPSYAAHDAGYVMNNILTYSFSPRRFYAMTSSNKENAPRCERHVTVIRAFTRLFVIRCFYARAARVPCAASLMSYTAAHR